MLKFRILTFIALFQIALGVSILAGNLLSSWDSHLYFSLFRMKDGKEYEKVEYKGENKEGVIFVLPYKKSPPPTIPVISVDKKSSTESFSVYPAQPMDWAVLFFRLHNMGVEHVGVLSPMTWDQSPNEIVSEALSHELKSFTSSRIGKTLSLSARESLPPEQWRDLALERDQYVGSIHNVPAANKFYGDAPQLTKEISVVPSLVENDDLFYSNTPGSNKSTPLFVRWNQSIIPTLPLILALDFMNLGVKDIYVHFGGSLRLGNSINIPIDETGRTELLPDSGENSVELSAILSENSPRSIELAQKKEIARTILNASPLVLISEAAMGSEKPDHFAFLTARTIKKLFCTVQPCSMVEINPVSPWIQWVLLIDVLVIGFWAFLFEGWIRRALLCFCFGIVPIVACYKWISATEWLPLTPYLASIPVLLILKHFFQPYRKEDGEQPLSLPNHASLKSSPLPCIIAPDHEFEEPGEVPIPRKNNKGNS